jgi:hypothetical protein
VLDHPMLKDSLPKLYCLHLRDRRMNRCPTVGSSSAEAPVLACLCLDSNEVSDRSTVSSLRPSDHAVLLALLLLLCNSSDGALVFTQCTNSSNHCTDACYLGVARWASAALGGGRAVAGGLLLPRLLHNERISEMKGRR